jgi:[ribosomal protein S5]-alanine N-acetyltransferase
MGVGVDTGIPLEICTTRLRLRAFREDDASFVLQLMNEPAFHRFIGDRGIRSMEDAQRYLRDGPIASYGQHGHGLLHVSLVNCATPVGMCGLVRRDSLPGPDIGFALLQAHENQGYATEAALAVLDHAQNTLRLPAVYGITQPDNYRSMRTLEKLGLRLLECRQVTDDGPKLNVFIRKFEVVS